MPFLPPNQESQSSLSLRFNGHFSGEPVLAGFVEAKGDGRGGDNWSYKCKTNTHLSHTKFQHQPKRNRAVSILGDGRGDDNWSYKL